EGWNPGLRRRPWDPGGHVGVGDYRLSVNGVELAAVPNPDAAFVGTADRQLLLRVNDRPEAEGSRLVTVVPVSSENALRRMAWVEGNRRTVDSLSDGRLAYVWIPNTAEAGYTYFNRRFF